MALKTPRMSFICLSVSVFSWSFSTRCDALLLTVTYTTSVSRSLSSIVNVPGEWTLRREFLRLQTEDRNGGRDGGRGGGGGQQRHNVGFIFACSSNQIHYSEIFDSLIKLVQQSVRP